MSVWQCDIKFLLGNNVPSVLNFAPGSGAGSRFSGRGWRVPGAGRDWRRVLIVHEYARRKRFLIIIRGENGRWV